MRERLVTALRVTAPRTYRRLSLARSYATVGFRRRSAVFDRIHRDNRWHSATSRSGTGSEPEQTVAVREQLPGLLAELSCRSLLDIPCGDFSWMSLTELPVERYIGADIVPALTDANELRYGSERRRFRTIDLVTGPLPMVDLIFCRDCLVHLSFADIAAALGTVRASGATYLLTTTFTGREANHDIPTGAWRPLNLERAPFCFPPALQYLDERCQEGRGRFADKQLGLWRVADLPVVSAGPPSSGAGRRSTG